MYRTMLAVAVTALLACTAFASPARAEAFPSGPITIYSPAAAGSSSDVEARFLGRIMSVSLKTPITIIDMPGGSGSVAEAQLQSRPADGSTLLFEPLSLLTYTLAKKMLPFGINDFVGVAGVGGDAVALVVRKDDDRFASLAAFVDYAHQHPDTVTVGGFGTAGQFAQTYYDLAATARLTARYIPYNGGGELLVALLGRQIAAAVTAPSNVITNDKLKLLAIASRTTFSPLPDTPTFVASGYNVVQPVRRGFFAKAGTPQPVLQRLAQAVGAAVNDPQWQKVARQEVIESEFMDQAAWHAYTLDAFKQESAGLARAQK